MCKREHTAALLFIALCTLSVVYGQGPPQSSIGASSSGNYFDQMHSDTAVVRINYREKSEKSDAFYDTLLNRKYKRSFTRWLVQSFVRGRNSSDEGEPSLDFKRNRLYFQHFEGKRIRAIYITQANVFSPRDSSEKVGWVQRFVDKLHIRTKQKQLTQNFLFKVGDTINPYVMGINEELLRSLPNLSTAYFVVMPVAGDSTGVTVSVFARDNWSISGDIRLGSDENKFSLFDRNFLGTGDELKVSLISEKSLRHMGPEVEYTARNLLGSFTDVNIRLGIGANRTVSQFAMERRFVLPSDWGYGLRVGRIYAPEDMALSDTSYYVNRFVVDGWAGKSWCLDWRNGTSIYLAGTLGKEQYSYRPPVGEALNPYYHDSEMFLFSLGVVRRNFFQGNMIYGYGRTEDIPYGFRAELVGGRQWEEKRGRRDYWGLRGYWGNLVGDHYLETGLSAGSFFTKDYAPEQAVISGYLKYFTPLLRIGTSYVRQFGTISATMGFNRLEGEREALRYDSRLGMGIRGLGSNVWFNGYNRLTLSSETVLFTPIFFYHFRFAFFLFGDVGWLGNNNNLFANRFTGAVGAGVRIKNERLIFNNVQIRLGFAFNRPPEVGYNYFSISNEQDYLEANLAPGRPQVIPYR